MIAPFDHQTRRWHLLHSSSEHEGGEEADEEGGVHQYQYWHRHHALVDHLWRPQDGEEEDGDAGVAEMVVGDAAVAVVDDGDGDEDVDVVAAVAFDDNHIPRQGVEAPLGPR